MKSRHAGLLMFHIIYRNLSAAGQENRCALSLPFHKSELFKLVVKRSSAYAQKFGRLRLVAVAQGKSLLKGLHFRIAYRIGKGKGRFRRFRRFRPGGGGFPRYGRKTGKSR